MRRATGPHRNHGCRMRDFEWRGRRCISLENERVRVVIAPDKGCDIIEFTHKPTDTECLYQAPTGLPRPGDLPATPAAAGPFRDLFPGGWYIMLPNGPGPCVHAGAEWGHHGEATLLAWSADAEDDDVDRVSFRATVRLRRIPLAVERRFALAGAGATLTLDEVVTNEANTAVDLLWGHHPTFGTPLVAPGTLICVPAAAGASTGAAVPDAAALRSGAAGTWPHLPGRDGEPVDLAVMPPLDPPSHDFIRLDGLSAGWFALVNAERGSGFALRWDERLFPTLGLWRLNGGDDGYPWWGTRRLLALEPASDLPSLSESVLRGTAIRLGPGESRATRIEATAFAAHGRVAAVGWGGTIELETMA